MRHHCSYQVNRRYYKVIFIEHKAPFYSCKCHQSYVEQLQNRSLFDLSPNRGTSKIQRLGVSQHMSVWQRLPSGFRKISATETAAVTFTIRERDAVPLPTTNNIRPFKKEEYSKVRTRAKQRNIGRQKTRWSNDNEKCGARLSTIGQNVRRVEEAYPTVEKYLPKSRNKIGILLGAAAIHGFFNVWRSITGQQSHVNQWCMNSVVSFAIQFGLLLKKPWQIFAQVTHPNRNPSWSCINCKPYMVSLKVWRSITGQQGHVNQWDDNGVVPFVIQFRLFLKEPCWVHNMLRDFC